MSQRTVLEQAQARDFGWLRTQWGGYKYALEYCPHREKLWFYELGALYPATKHLVRADVLGPVAKLKAVDRYGYENKRGRSVKLYAHPSHSRTIANEDLRPLNHEEKAEITIADTFYRMYDKAEKRKDHVGMWMYNEGLIVPNDDRHAVEREYLKGWGFREKNERYYRDRMELVVPTDGADKVISYPTSTWLDILLGLGMVEQEELDVLKLDTTVPRKFWTEKYDDDHNVVGATLDYPLYLCTEMGHELDDEGDGELVYSGFVNTYGGE